MRIEKRMGYSSRLRGKRIDGKEKDVRLTGCRDTGDEFLLSIPGVGLEIWMAEALVEEGRRPWWIPRVQLTRRNIYIYLYICEYMYAQVLI